MESEKSLVGTAFKTLPSPLYYIQRLVTRKRLRTLVSAALSALIRLRHGAMSPAAVIR